MMGLNGLRLLDELLQEYPLQYVSDNLVLDLGCERGITSLFFCKRNGCNCVCKWFIDIRRGKSHAFYKLEYAGENSSCAWRCCKSTFRKNVWCFDKHWFVSLFCRKRRFFVHNILPYIKRGGIVLIAIFGIKNEYDGRSEELLTPWLVEDAYRFQSADFLETDDWKAQRYRRRQNMR